MTTPDSILLALQPESSADDLLFQASLWAAHLGSRIDLCTVLPAPLPTDPLHVTSSVQDATDAALANQRRMAEWLSDLQGELPEACRGKVDVLLGDPKRAIIERCASAKLLMVGTHHRRELTRLLLGSVAETLARTAPIPVLVLPTQTRALRTQPRIHLPIDPAEPNFQAVEWAKHHLGGAELTAVYLLPWVKIFGPLQPNGDIAMREAEEVLRQALIDGGHRDLASAVVVREETNVGEALAHEAETSHVDLIAMPTHGRTGLMHLLLGSVSERVVRAADCAVLVVR